MTMMKRIFGGTVAMAALATAAPAAAQYGYPQGYGYGGYNMTQVAAQQCTAAVNNRLYSRGGLSGIVGSLFGVSGTSPRVLSVTQVNPRRSSIRVTGLASSGRYAYNPYGYGYYGALGAGYAADLRFRCDVDYRGFVRNVDIDRR